LDDADGSTWRIILDQGLALALARANFTDDAGSIQSKRRRKLLRHLSFLVDILPQVLSRDA
jgi:hypothetical protein